MALLVDRDPGETEIAGPVAVIGAGIVGACIARRLALRGLPVTVYDPAPGRGSSYGNAGMVTETEVRPTGPDQLHASLRMLLCGRASIARSRDALRSLPDWLVRHVKASFGSAPEATMVELHRLARQSLDLYREMSEDEGLDLGFRRSGWLWPFAATGPLDQMSAEVRKLASAGAEIERLGAEDCLRLEPRLGDQVCGGLLFPRDGQLDPTRAVPSIFGAAIAAGARHVPQKVTGFVRAGETVTAVETARGRSTVGAVVLCAGVATRAMARQLGARVPIVPGHGWSMTFEQAIPQLSMPLMLAEQDAVASPLHASLRFTTGMRLGGRAPLRPSGAEVAALLRAVERILPGLGPLSGGSLWVGARPMTPSGLPVIARLPGQENVIVAAGHGTLGVTLAPVTAARVDRLLGG